MIIFKLADLFLFFSGCMFWSLYIIGAIRFVGMGG